MESMEILVDFHISLVSYQSKMKEIHKWVTQTYLLVTKIHPFLSIAVDRSFRTMLRSLFWLWNKSLIFGVTILILEEQCRGNSKVISYKYFKMHELGQSKIALTTCIKRNMANMKEYIKPDFSLVFHFTFLI